MTPRHPAPFSKQLLPMFAELLPPERYPRVLDPFAGIGRIHQLPQLTLGIEIETEWAGAEVDDDDMSLTIVGDCREIAPLVSTVDAICTSCCYGNRFADHHRAKDPSSRRSYTHDLGRQLTDGNSGELHWGDDYRAFHVEAWTAVAKVLKPGGRFVLNISDHVRGGVVQPVSMWHLGVLSGILGVAPTWEIEVPTQRMRHGQNHQARVDHELVYVWDTEPFDDWEGEG